MKHGSRLLRFAIAALGCIFTGSAAAAAAKCKVLDLADLPITMYGTQPMLEAKINGAAVRLMLDSGAFFSTLTPAAAKDHGLFFGPMPPGMYIVGVGGKSTTAALTTVRKLTLGKEDIDRVQFFVAGNEIGGGAVGVLGQNLLRTVDVEYDLASGIVRLMRPTDCGDTGFAYWAGDGGYSTVEIQETNNYQSRTMGTAMLNGHPVRVLFDTGASTSVVSLSAAARVGIRPDSPGVRPGGAAHGMGRATEKAYIAQFASFKLGDEEIRNPRLMMADFDDTDMLVGADFFLSHHVYVANSQRRMYFTYGGGKVFAVDEPDVSQAKSAGGAAAEVPSAHAADAGTTGTASTASPTDPADADGLLRRGAGFAARGDLAHALMDLNHAAELAPSDPAVLYQRAGVEMRMRHFSPAVRDLDQSLKIRPDDFDALIARAAANFELNQTAQILPDLDHANIMLKTPGADSRLALGDAYEGTLNFPQAIAQYDQWIAAHSNDDRRGEAYNSRCWARASWNHELDKALSDCNHALRVGGDTGDFHDSRGFVELRLGQLDAAIADYNAALKEAPHAAWSLYGRGIARIRKGQTADGQADLAAAQKADPRITEEAKRIGVAPPG